MRIRIKFSKTGPLRFIGNLDLHTLWERAARRADLPLSYSHGFHPQPKINIASPLPLGCSSRCEFVDMRLDEDVDPTRLVEPLQATLPAGLQILGIETVDSDAPALQSVLTAAEYEITLPAGCAVTRLRRQISTLMDAASLPRERRGKSYDLRPLIQELHLEVDDSGGLARLRMRLSARDGATGRPDEVLEALAVPIEGASIERTNLIFQA